MSFILKNKKIFITLIVILAFAVVFIIKLASHDNISGEKNISSLSVYLYELKSLVDEVSNKEFAVDGVLKDEYADTLNKINILSEQFIDNVSPMGKISEYNYPDYRAFHYSAKMDLLSLLSVTDISLLDSESDREKFIQSFIYYTDLYYIPLISLYENNIDVNNYLQGYKEPFCSHQECMEELKRQMKFLADEENAISALNLSVQDNLVKNKIADNYRRSYSMYGVNSGLYEYVGQFSQWDIFHKQYISDNYESIFLRNLYKYKASKAMKNIYLSKIYMQFIMLNDKYMDNIKQQKMEQEYPEEFYEESTLFVSGCTNPRYLLENTLNKCADFIINADTKEDAFSYLEDENMKDYVMIDDKLCAAREGSKYKFYDNDNKLCKILQEKLK